MSEPTTVSETATVSETTEGQQQERALPLVQRFQPAAGAAVLALTATDWIGKTIETEGGPDMERTFTFWGLFESVNDRLVVPLGLGAALIVAFIVVSLFGSHVRPAAATMMSWLAVLVTGIIMLQTDNDFSPGPGAWLTLIVTTVAAVVGTVDWVYRSHDGLRKIRAERAMGF